MLLKKQTVWLLTMLSLVVVLSVYYVTSDPKQGDMATVEKADKVVKEDAGAKDSTTKDKNVNTTSVSDEVFETIRIERQDARSQQREDLTNRLASTELSADERSKAVDEMQKLTEIAQKEKVLETLIKSKGYKDALVRADGDEIKVTVKAKEPNKTAANDIIRLVMDEVDGMQTVAVEFQPEK